MRIKIKYRLFLALLAASALTAVSLAVIMQWSISRGFLRYVNTLDEQRLERAAATLSDLYDRQGSWAFVRRNPRRVLHEIGRRMAAGDDGEAEGPEITSPARNREERRPGHRPSMRRPGLGHRFEARLLLFNAERQLILGHGPVPTDIKLEPLIDDKNNTVGYLGLSPRRKLSERNQLRFVRRQKDTLALISVMVLLISGLLALPLARRLVAPITALALATRRLAGGDYTYRVAADSSDELGRLARDFNSLAFSLEKNEQSRRQWVADISHELRTPISVLRGEIEALEDGVRPLTLEAIGSLNAEVRRLTRLVDDLYQLSLSDAGGLTYRKQRFDLGKQLGRVLASHLPELASRGIELETRLPEEGEFMVFADPDRLQQLFANLLDNSRKYTDSPGRLRVSVSGRQGRVTILIEDSAPGVPETDLDQIFERLYRVEDSRSRATGGAGLGLSICRNVVEAHQGSIAARPSELGGLAIEISLPLDEEEP
jgi:two-component system sensor histidine kinase BaeS